jgi:hypothetical protein
MDIPRLLIKASVITCLITKVGALLPAFFLLSFFFYKEHKNGELPIKLWSAFNFKEKICEQIHMMSTKNNQKEVL